VTETPLAAAATVKPFAALPKIELHRHLEGSVRLTTLLEIARQHQIIDVPTYDLEGIRKYVQIMPGEPNTATNFLSKFSVLRRFYRSPEIIQRIVHEAIEDAEADNIRYLELRFTPKALSKLMDYSYEQVVRWVVSAVEEAQQGRKIKVRLIISMNRHETLNEGGRAIEVAIAFRDRGVVGVDLAGQEAGFPASPFISLFERARKAGLFVTIHAGEWSGPRNIREAIEDFGAKRIGHGVRIVEDSETAQRARDAGVAFEVCLTSNVQSGVVRAIEYHPVLDMNFLGLKTTLNTDDPCVSNITLSHEYEVLVNQLNLPINTLYQHIRNSAESAFLPPAEKATLLADINGGLRETKKEDKPQT
jgi:adenosine deaminase